MMGAARGIVEEVAEVREAEWVEEAVLPPEGVFWEDGSGTEEDEAAEGGVVDVGGGENKGVIEDFFSEPLWDVDVILMLFEVEIVWCAGVVVLDVNGGTESDDFVSKVSLIFSLSNKRVSVVVAGLIVASVEDSSDEEGWEDWEVAGVYVGSVEEVEETEEEAESAEGEVEEGVKPIEGWGETAEVLWAEEATLFNVEASDLGWEEMDEWAALAEWVA